MKTLDLNKMSPIEVYKIMVGLIAPRPIGWISTISKEGIFNLAPFSFFNMVGNNPPTLMFAASMSRTGKIKDSFINAEQTQCFVHNVVTRSLAEKMVATSEEFPYGMSEFEKVGLTPLQSSKVLAPRVKEAAINVECQVSKVLSLGNKPGNGQLIFGEVVCIHINDESVLDETGLINAENLPVIARLGKDEYMDFGDIFSMERP